MDVPSRGICSTPCPSNIPCRKVFLYSSWIRYFPFSISFSSPYHPFEQMTFPQTELFGHNRLTISDKKVKSLLVILRVSVVSGVEIILQIHLKVPVKCNAPWRPNARFIAPQLRELRKSMHAHQKLRKLNLEVINDFFQTKWVFAQKNYLCSRYLLVYSIITW
jgi:hypothetical protein